jgi:hypothetical protein
LCYKLVVSDNESQSLDPVASLALIETEQRRIGRQVTFNPVFMNAMWAVVWFAGFGAAYLGYGADRRIPAWLGAAIPAALIVTGLATSIAYGIRVGSGISGPSRTAGAMYGWSWTLGFVCLTAVDIAIGRHLPDSTVTLLWSATSLLLVGVLQMVGAALWRDLIMFATGAWTMVCAAGAALLGVPGNFLVLSLAGGGGFAVLAAYLALRRHR